MLGCTNNHGQHVSRNRSSAHNAPTELANPDYAQEEIIHASMTSNWLAMGVRSCIILGLPRHLVQKLDVGTVHVHA